MGVTHQPAHPVQKEFDVQAVQATQIAHQAHQAEYHAQPPPPAIA